MLQTFKGNLIPIWRSFHHQEKTVSQSFIKLRNFLGQKKEATETIKSVNAQYGYTPEFLGIYAQAGAVSFFYEQFRKALNGQMKEGYHCPHKCLLKALLPMVNLNLRNNI